MSDRYPLRLGPFVVVARLIEEAVPEIGLAFSRRARRVRPCLLKHVRLAKSGSEDLQAAFQRASRLSRRLSHASLARAFAVGRLEGRLFVAEAFRPGVLLSQLPPAAMPAATAAHIAREIASALVFLHGFDGGLCHRRLSPEQILLSFRGEVRVLDGPFAGPVKPGEAPFARAMRPSLRYVPPEIAVGGTGDARSDLYMLGVLLWEMLAGRTYESAFGGWGGRELPRLEAEIPAPLRELVARMLAADPADRPARADDVRKALGRFSPWGWGGRRAVAAMIAGSVDVRQQLTQLRRWQAEARALLPRREPDREGASAGGSRAHAREGLLSRRLLIPAALGAIGMTGVLLTWQPREAPPPASPAPLTDSTAAPAPAAGEPPPAFERTAAESPPLPAPPAGDPPPASAPPATGPPPLSAPPTGDPPPASAPPATGPPPLSAPPTGNPPPASARAARPAPPAEPAAASPPPASEPAAATLPPVAGPPVAGTASPGVEVAPTTPGRPRRDTAVSPPAGAQARGDDLLASAEVRFQWRDFDAAERLVRAAMTELPASPRPHYLLGLVLLARGEASEAAVAFARTIDIEPGYSDAARKLRIAQERASIK